MKEKMKKNWLVILLIIVIVLLVGGGFFLYKTQKQNGEILTKRIQVLQEYIQGYIVYGPPFFEIRELKNDIFIPTGITTKYLTKSYYSGDEEGMVLEFNKDGKGLFAELTRRNIGNSIALFFEGVIISAPEVASETIEGKIMITGNLTKEETENLIERIRYEIAKNSF